MSDKQLSHFLADLQELLLSDPGASRTDPVSPPEWESLGWKVGWIAEEGHTGLQFLLTDEESWPGLSRDWGSSPSQKAQVFSDRFAQKLKDLAAELGKPVSLKSLKYRRMDLAAFPGREGVESQRWWRVDFSSRRTGSWHFIFPDRFYGLFESDQPVRLPEPPWSFSELWRDLPERARRQLLERLGRDRNRLNLLAGLVASGVLEASFVTQALARTPAEEFERALRERQELLASNNARGRKQTQNQWKKDANERLTEQVGEWLEDGELTGAPWQDHGEDWNRYRQKQREVRFGHSAWTAYWKQLSDDQLKQVIPRLDGSLLAKSSAQLPSSLRERMADHARPALAKQLRDDAPSYSREEVFEAREQLADELNEWAEKFGIEWGNFG